MKKGFVMRLVARFLWVFLIAGCNEVTTPTTAPLELVIEGAAGRLEGVEVCQGETDNCAFSDANGEVTLQVPFDQEIFYTLEKEGYDSFLFADVIPESSFRGIWYLQTDAEAKGLFEELMSPYPRRGTGSIGIFIGPGFAGATFDLLNATGTRYYEPYQDPWDPPPYTDPALEATSESGVGGFVELTPGTVQIQFGGTAENCVPNIAWPGDVENSVRVPVLEDHGSIVFVTCSVPP